MNESQNASPEPNGDSESDYLLEPRRYNKCVLDRSRVHMSLMRAFLPENVQQELNEYEMDVRGAENAVLVSK